MINKLHNKAIKNPNNKNKNLLKKLGLFHKKPLLLKKAVLKRKNNKNL